MELPFKLSRLYAVRYLWGRMSGGTLNIVGTKVSPELFVRVDVMTEKNAVDISVERVQLDGSEVVRNAAGSFNGEHLVLLA